LNDGGGEAVNSSRTGREPVDTAPHVRLVRGMAYRTVRMGPEHKEAVLRLWRESVYDPRIAAIAEQRFPWFYEQNPAGPPVTWLGLLEQGAEPRHEVIGCGSLYPRTTLIGGHPVRCGVVCDFAVDKAHRIGGCAVAIQRAILQQGCEAGYRVLYGYPNNGSLPVVKRVGYEMLGEAAPYSKPLVSGDKLRTHAASADGGLLRHPLAQRALSVPHVVEAAGIVLDLGLAALDLARMLRALGAYRVEVGTRADARFDELWSRRADTRVMGEKSTAYLNWRYAAFKTAEYRFFSLVERRTGRLAAYLVYSVDDKRAFVVDLFTPRCDETVDHLLLHFSMWMRWERRSSIYLSYFGDPSFGKRLEALQFFRRPGDRQVILGLDKDLSAETAATLRDPANWFMLDGELDV
jgi:hypothetical protein